MITKEDFLSLLNGSRKEIVEEKLSVILQAVTKGWVDPNTRLDDGFTCAMLFLGIGTSKEISLLDKAGVNFSAKTNEGNIAFDYALRNGNLDAINYILENKKEILDSQHGLVMKSFAINTPINKLHEVLVTFKDHGIDINATTPSTGMNGLHYLSRRPNKDEINDCFDILAENGVNSKSRDKSGKKPKKLPIAASPPRDKVTKKRGAAHNAKDDLEGKNKKLKVWVNDSNELVIEPEASPSQPMAANALGSKLDNLIAKK